MRANDVCATKHSGNRGGETTLQPLARFQTKDLPDEGFARYPYK
jgi:hypothetical protein